MKEKFQGFSPRPNMTGYTAIPNEFFDEVLPQINNMSELKILLAVFRKTYGWVKEIDHSTGQPIYKLEDEISYSQFEELTGLSSTSVATGLNRAIGNHYLEKLKQGNYSGVTSSYRIVTRDGSKPNPELPPMKQEKKQKQKPKPQYLDLGNDDVNVKGKPLGTSLADITGANSTEEPPQLSNEKQDILNDIFGSPSSKTSEPKKKENQKSPHQDFISNWYRCYYSKLNLTYGNLTGKEHGHIKSMLKEYDVATLVKGMEFYMDNYTKLDGVPSDYPTITVFYSWRKKIIPASIHGVVGKANKPSRNAREFESTKWEGDDFFDN
jgi:hypothetical protein